jgi:hypothetical protein
MEQFVCKWGKNAANRALCFARVSTAFFGAIIGPWDTRQDSSSFRQPYIPNKRTNCRILEPEQRPPTPDARPQRPQSDRHGGELPSMNPEDNRNLTEHIPSCAAGHRSVCSPPTTSRICATCTPSMRSAAVWGLGPNTWASPRQMRGCELRPLVLRSSVRHDFLIVRPRPPVGASRLEPQDREDGIQSATVIGS